MFSALTSASLWVQVLSRLLAELHDPATGRIMVPGFYEVRDRPGVSGGIVVSFRQLHRQYIGMFEDLPTLTSPHTFLSSRTACPSGIHRVSRR